MRPIAAPFVAAPPAGVRFRARLKVDADDEAVLGVIGEHLGSLAVQDLAARCKGGLLDAKGRTRVPKTARGSPLAHGLMLMNTQSPERVCHSGILEYRMTRPRTTEMELIAEAVDGALAALETVGIKTQARLPAPDKAEDSSPAHAVLEVVVDDRSLNMSVEAVSYCTAQNAAALVSRRRPCADTLPLLVADRITAEARTILTDAGWSWLDRRGRLHLRGPGVRVDQPVQPADRTTASTAGPAITGRSGITVAYWLCAHPGERVSPNRHAAVLGLAPSTISTTVRRLADAGLVDEDGAAIAPELFWELAAVWCADRTWLVRRPDPKEHVPLDPLVPSWRMTGTAAAAAYGAPLTAAGEGVLDLYVTSPVELSIATRRYAAAAPGAGSAVIAVPPTSLVAERNRGDVVPTIEGWPAAPLVAVALDVAQDRGRGREILEGWNAGRDIWL